MLIKWLDLKSKKGFVETIKNSYKKNIDYVIKGTTSTTHCGSNKKIYMLTSDAAKRFCLLTKSPKGEDVRAYFIEIEKALFKFQQFIIKGLEDKIKKLENNQKPKTNPEKGVIYVFRALNTEITLHKIGRTINLKKRLNSHNSGLANDIELILIYEADNIKKLESCAKIMMKKAQYRKYKEVYQVDINIIKKVIKDCDSKLTEINNEISKQKAKQKGGKQIITEADRLFLVIQKN